MAERQGNGIATASATAAEPAAPAPTPHASAPPQFLPEPDECFSSRVHTDTHIPKACRVACAAALALLLKQAIYLGTNQAWSAVAVWAKIILGPASATKQKRTRHTDAATIIRARLALLRNQQFGHPQSPRNLSLQRHGKRSRMRPKRRALKSWPAKAGPARPSNVSTAMESLPPRTPSSGPSRRYTLPEPIPAHLEHSEPPQTCPC